MSFRYALALQYDGATYKGWQRQTEGVRTVQASLELALAKVAGVEQPISVQCAGRTDAGVHASHQVVSFDSPVERPEKAWVLGGNAHLDKDIALQWAVPVSDDFNARFSATARRYRYCLFNHSRRSAHLRNNLTWVGEPLDVDKMHSAAQALLGERDFSAYQGAACQSRTPMRNVHFVEVYRRGELIVVDIQANAFLLHMVRNIVGVLIAIGKGDAPESWAAEVLESRDRCQGGVTAKPYGLYLVDVLYPEQFGLPEASLGPCFLTALGE